MAIENGYLYVGTINITAATGAASQALTAREIDCQSVFLLPKSGNTGTVYLVDDGNDALTFPIPSTGLTLPISSPAKIKVAADTSGDDIDWVAI